MTTEVKGLTDVVRDVSDIKRDASRIADDLKTNMAEVRQALGMVEELSSALHSAGAELRGVLGTQTNNPPADAK